MSHIGVMLHDFQLGGSERIALRLAREWAAMGRQATLLVGEDAGPLRHLVTDTVSVRVADRPAQWQGRDIDRLSFWAVKAAREDGITNMFVPGNSYFRAVPRLAKHNIQVVTKLSNPIIRYDRSAVRNLGFCLITSLRLRKLCALVAPCAAQAEEAGRQLGTDIPLAVIPNPVLDAFPKIEDAQKIDGQLCAVGRLEPQKNFALLLEAFALLDDSSLSLKIAGDGSQRAQLEAQAQRLGIADRVAFLGVVQDAMPLMAESEALVLSSDFEGYPAVAIEALAAGTYVIARDCCSGIQEILRAPHTGSIVREETPQALAGAIRAFMQNRRFDAQAARASASRCLIGPIAKSYLDLFDEVAISGA